MLNQSPRGEVLLRAWRLVREAGGRRGKGCRFSSALAAGLARGVPMLQAAQQAKRVVGVYLRTGRLGARD